MAVTKTSYYPDEGPKIPSPPGYSAPDPHAAKVGQHVFEAPNTNVDGTFGGVGAVSHGIPGVSDITAPASTYNPTTGSGSDIASGAQSAAQAAFDAAAQQRQPMGESLPRGHEPSELGY